MMKTLYDKLWKSHVVREIGADEALLYVDLHLIHEVTSPQAFEGLTLAGREVRRPELTFAIADHNTPTVDQQRGIDAVQDPDSRLQLATFEANVSRFAMDYLPMGAADNGIVHVVAPELGRTQPGMVVVCGDSHTSTHGAFGALAFGIGTSEVEHVLATQMVRSRKAGNMLVEMTGTTPPGVQAKDLALALIARIGTGGGTGAVIEFAGDPVTRLSMEGRMTLCNMAIEAGARSGMVAPDETTYAYLAGRPGAPAGAAFAQARAHWEQLSSDPGAHYDRHIRFNVGAVEPMITWGTSPEQAVGILGSVPVGDDPGLARARSYMALEPGASLVGTPIDTVFIGSCTNGRLEDLRAAAAMIGAGRRVAPGVRALVVPGSGTVRRQAEAEGLDVLFRAAGFEWREPGCSMCIGLNADRLRPGERAVATSNRNFEGRQGPGGRTHLASPATAAASALTGCITDPRTMA